MSNQVHVLDYGAGNVRSLLNAITAVGFTPIVIQSPSELSTVKRLIFPGVGAFGSAMDFLYTHGYYEPLREFILTPGNEYLGICIGMQVLFETSAETPLVKGLGIIKGALGRFDESRASVPNIGWSGITPRKASRMWRDGGSKAEWDSDARVYFVHSFRAVPGKENEEWVAATTEYGGEEYISAVQNGSIMAVQFHPEKSGKIGLNLLEGFLKGAVKEETIPFKASLKSAAPLSKRIVACLDVRTNDEGDLVVTKGDSYDVRESSESANKKGRVRNLGKPVELAKRYYNEGADEVTFLNITSFRSEPLEDAPLLAVLEETSRSVFVPLTIGGGIRDYVDVNGKKYSSLDVADRYFRAGADKVSIGSDAVMAAERLRANGFKPDGTSCIEQISRAYGAQAVVISVDPRRVYLETSDEVKAAIEAGHTVVEDVPDLREGCAPNAKCKVWYQCTIKGGREGRDLDAVALCKACEKLGAGEILLNSIDCDGQKKGFDTHLIRAVCAAVKLPVIASSGAGSAQHFVDVFQQTRAEAALAAGIFHRDEVPLGTVKNVVKEAGLPVR